MPMPLHIGGAHWFRMAGKSVSEDSRLFSLSRGLRGRFFRPAAFLRSAELRGSGKDWCYRCNRRDIPWFCGVDSDFLLNLLADQKFTALVELCSTISL